MSTERKERRDQRRKDLAAARERNVAKRLKPQWEISHGVGAANVQIHRETMIKAQMESVRSQVEVTGTVEVSDES